MDPTVSHVQLGEVLVADDSAFAALAEAVDGVLGSGLCPASGADAAGLLQVLEREARRLHAAAVEAMHQIELGGLHRTDGHGTVKAQARHVNRLSNGEASNRAKTMRMLAALEEVKAALWAGQIGIDQVQLLARVHANPRVCGAMQQRQGWFIEQAGQLPYAMFEIKVREWERLIDEDGPEPENERTHRRRRARLAQDPIDLSWELVAQFGAMQGMAMSEIWEHYVDAEWHADWEKAAAEHGDQAAVAHLARTDGQRRADALWQIFQDAAGADGSAVPPGFCHNILWSAEAYEEMLRRFAGAAPRPHDPDTYRCQTIDGVPLEPTEAAANAMVGAVRRVVINANGVVLDMGHKRFFTGALRDAINLQSSGRCVWPGCQVPATRCEADHMHDHSRGGLTNPGNGAPLCGRHNRWKQKRYTLWRDPTGQWHTTRPDGTPINN